MKCNEIGVERMSANKRIRGIEQRNQNIFFRSSQEKQVCAINTFFYYFILAVFTGKVFCLSAFICLYCCISNCSGKLSVAASNSR